jgi:hypothetical protein
MVEQLGNLVCFGIDACQIRPFVKITVNASDGEISGAIETTVLLGDNVLDMKCCNR